ncbi:DNA polymerase III subunit epsilon [Algibacter amylolyticus]|uniref:DNA polymerase III subunit epsilon n=1 Tax=Algibacter amylolyticus TaxID=1608400 RepID=A0A5M7AZ11_9FLAO|nr:exonuclease domain-containing protein [Algibacter amylolyticus]KAA5821870.1 DNA polymerase III subunit epsilon [Algibacter amylolyticus]TSJ73154.1 DNA polymerase III subunit epsilon [Algibacter amylolyticus]
MMYTIIDVETTGQGNKLTEISIFKFDGAEIIDEFTSLINPESHIPDYITALTGIDNGMVAHAPTFTELAEDILKITENTIFVAHNVNFDYNAIRNEFKAIGMEFNRKKLCTVRLSRKLIPGHKSYSLGKICTDLSIPINGRHRARGDAEATVILFEMLLKAENAETVFDSFLKKSSKEGTLPPHLPNAVFNAIPNSPGIYYFKNKKGKVIYVGKAKDLKKRVLGHFYNKSEKELNLCRETADIDFELSGSELIALLMEDAAIKHYYPEYNQASKRKPKAYAIFSFEDRKGITHLAYNTLKATPNPLLIFYNITECRQFLERLCMQFELCPKYCHLQEGVSQCSHFAIKTCKGICFDNEPVNTYNQRVKNAIQHAIETSQNKLIKEKGRHPEEDAFVLIKNGVYLGYGFVENTAQITNETELESYLIPQQDNADVWRVLRKRLMQ